MKRRRMPLMVDQITVEDEEGRTIQVNLAGTMTAAQALQAVFAARKRARENKAAPPKALDA